MSGHRVLFAVAESCPFDSLLVRDMKKTVSVLLQRFDSMGLLRGLIPRQTGRIASLLRGRNIQIKIIEKVADVNQVFGKR